MTAPTTIKMLFLSFNFIGPLLLFQNILITLNKLSVNADHFTSYKEEKEHHTMTLTDSHLVFTTICQLRKIFLFEISRFQRWSLANASICTSYDNGGGGGGRVINHLPIYIQKTLACVAPKEDIDFSCFGLK